MQVRLTEERSPSKASFLDADPLPVYDPTQPAPTFSGRHLTAAVNGAYTIMRKGAPAAVVRGSSGRVVHPVRLAVDTSQEFASDWKL